MGYYAFRTANPVWRAFKTRERTFLHGETEFTDPLYGLALSPDGRHIATAHGGAGLRISSLSGKQVVANTAGHRGNVNNSRHLLFDSESSWQTEYFSLVAGSRSLYSLTGRLSTNATIASSNNSTDLRISDAFPLRSEAPTALARSSSGLVACRHENPSGSPRWSLSVFGGAKERAEWPATTRRVAPISIDILDAPPVLLYGADLSCF